MWIGLIIVLFVFVYWGVPYIHGIYSRFVLKSKAVKSKSVAVTFDDGPGDRLTGAVMDLFTEHSANATFFVLGRNIVGREEIVKEEVERGHEICSHGFDHLNYWKVSPLRALRDIKRGWQAIDAALGLNRGKYPFRPPYGKLNIVCLLYLFIKKVPIVYWTVDSGDTWKIKPDSNRNAIFAKDSNGAVSVYHDFSRSGEKIESWVLESVRSVLVTAKEMNMRVVTISELLTGREQNKSKCTNS